MNHSHNQAGVLWFRFRDSLVDTLCRVDEERLIDAWGFQTRRTSFYHDHKGLCYASNSAGYDVESNSVSHEVSKLAILAVPLRVLVTVAEWSVDADDRWVQMLQMGSDQGNPWNSLSNPLRTVCFSSLRRSFA